jgi:hypothetical protein
MVHCTIQHTGASTEYSTLCYARAAEGGAGEEERRKDEGTGERAKEAARAVCGKATGAWVIGGRGGRRRAMEGECDGKAVWHFVVWSATETVFLVRLPCLRVWVPSAPSFPHSALAQ